MFGGSIHSTASKQSVDKSYVDLLHGPYRCCDAMP